jgi:hypothetical protein
VCVCEVQRERKFTILQSVVGCGLECFSKGVYDTLG